VIGLTGLNEFGEVGYVLLQLHPGDGDELARHENFAIFIADARTYHYHYNIYYS
jgi:hypothetical protein